jgi:hypothetical protein
MLIVQVMMAMSAGGVVWGQQNRPIRNVYDATSKMGNLMLNTANALKFRNENNYLDVDQQQYCIAGDSTWVAALVRANDYYKYWRGKNVTSDRFTWVFIPENFMNVCRNKNITNIANQQTRSTRLCKLLGLDVDARDTIVYMRVLRDSLFRPAYNTSVVNRVTNADRGSNTIINGGNARIKRWMIGEQRTNVYPWTRMGYTFDWGGQLNWGNSVDYIGVSEFILKPNTPITVPDTVTIMNITRQGKWRSVSRQ